MDSYQRLYPAISSPVSLTPASSLADAPPNAPYSASVDEEQSVAAGRCARYRLGAACLSIAVISCMLVGMTPFFCALGPMVTADPAYTPIFNTTDARYTLTGTGRSEFDLIFFPLEKFPITTQSIVDGVAEYSNGTYRATSEETDFFGCNYTVYSTVTALDAYKSPKAGEKLQLTVPGCTAVLVARYALIVYMSVHIVAVLLTATLWLILHRDNNDDDHVREHGLPLWGAAVAFTLLDVALGRPAPCGSSRWTTASSIRRWAAHCTRSLR